MCACIPSYTHCCCCCLITSDYIWSLLFGFLSEIRIYRPFYLVACGYVYHMKCAMTCTIFHCVLGSTRHTMLVMFHYVQKHTHIYIYYLYLCINSYIYLYICICISHPHFKEGFLFVNPLSTVNYDKRMFDVSIRIKYPITVSNIFYVYPNA